MGSFAKRISKEDCRWTASWRFFNREKFWSWEQAAALGLLSWLSPPKKIINDINTTALDVLTTDTKQHWPIESYGHREILCAARREVWSEQFSDDLRRMFGVIEVLPTEGLVFW